MSLGYSRSKLRLFIYPSVQVYLCTLFTLFFLLGSLLMFGAVYWLISDLTSSYNFDETMRLQFLLGHLLVQKGPFLFLAILVAAILCVPLGLILSHKLAGPLFVFRRHLQMMGAAQSLATVKLRKEDFLDDLLQELNSLSAQMAPGRKP